MTDSEPEVPVDGTEAEPGGSGGPTEPGASGASEGSPSESLESDAMRLDLSAVVTAAEALTEVNLGRTDAVLMRWLLRKRCGIRVSEPGDPESSTDAIVTSDDCYEFARDFLGMQDRNEKPYYNPFKGESTGTPDALKPPGDNNDWAKQTLYTQVGRTKNKRERAVFAASEEVEASTESLRTSGRSRTGLRERVVSVADYWTNLPELFSDAQNPRRRVPIAPLAVWRYRFATLAPETTESDLIDRFIAEFFISPTELNALFELPQRETDSASDAGEAESTHAD